jgi:hypothetical protein
LCRRNNCADDQCENNNSLRPALDHPALNLVRTYPPSPDTRPPGALLQIERR